MPTRPAFAQVEAAQARVLHSSNDHSAWSERINWTSFVIAFGGTRTSRMPAQFPCGPHADDHLIRVSAAHAEIREAAEHLTLDRCFGEHLIRSPQDAVLLNHHHANW